MIFFRSCTLHGSITTFLKMPEVYPQNGPPLSLGQQLCGGAEPEIFCPIYLLHWPDILPQSVPRVPSSLQVI